MLEWRGKIEIPWTPPSELYKLKAKSVNVLDPSEISPSSINSIGAFLTHITK